MQVVIMTAAVREIVMMSVRLTTVVCCQSLHIVVLEEDPKNY